MRQRPLPHPPPAVRPADVQIAKWKGCADQNEYCAAWAASGECDANKDYMHSHCKLSCKLCTAKDKDAPSADAAGEATGEAAAAA